MPKISQQQKIKKVVEYLGRNRLMTLGTAERNKPWLATLFYAYDKKLNLYFYSREDTRHCQYLKKNPSVSVAINHDWRNPDGTIKGLQIAGRARKIPQKNYQRCYALYKSRFRWADEFAEDHKLYVIKPLEIWYIDEKLFGHFYRVRML